MYKQFISTSYKLSVSHYNVYVEYPDSDYPLTGYTLSTSLSLVCDVLHYELLFRVITVGI